MKIDFVKLKGQAAIGWAAVTAWVKRQWSRPECVQRRADLRAFAQEHHTIVAAVYFALVFVLLVTIHVANASIGSMRSELDTKDTKITEQTARLEELELRLAEYRAAKLEVPRTMEAYRQTMAETEARYGLPKDILYYIAKLESNFNPDAVSPAGAVGLMQIVPRWHPEVDARDPHASIRYAGKYLKSMYDRFGSWGEALVAYNWGPANLEEYGFFNAPPVTHEYVIGVMAGVFSKEKT